MGLDMHYSLEAHVYSSEENRIHTAWALILNGFIFI